MNQQRLSPPLELDAGQIRFARRVASVLTERTAELPTDISERLRVAREQAVQRARAIRKAPVAAHGPMNLGGVLALLGPNDDRQGRWWIKFASVLPLVVLVCGLIAIQDWHVSNEISAAAEVDASLLADDLPPSAYSDPGFVEFLRSPGE